VKLKKVLEIHVNRSPIFERSGSDVMSNIKISLSQAILGGSTTIKTVLGEEFDVKIPTGANHGDTLKLRKKGIPIINGGGNRGDHMVRFMVDMPIKLTDKQKELLT